MSRLLLIALLPVLSSCAAARSAGEGVRTVASGWDEAAAQPLEDLGLRRQPVPMVLLQAQASPYDQRNLYQCSSIALEVERLTEALGPDTDEPPAPDGRLLSERASDAASKAALDAIRDAATDFIPGRTWIRRLTGAEQRSRDVQEAIQAGRLRRAFLKGLGMQRNCAPPAAPSWYRPRGVNWPG